MIPVLYIFSILIALGASQESPKCSIYDSECQKNYFQNVGLTYASVGIPEIGVPVIDPFRITNVTLPILGLWNLTLVEGVAEGIRNCIVTSYITDVPARIKKPEMICDPIIIKGHYKLTPSPAVRHNCDFDVHGEGNMTINLEKWFFKFQYPFKIVRHADGQIYTKAFFNKAVYEAGILGKVTASIDGLKMGNKDISHLVTSFVNTYWKLIMYSDLGKFINDKSAQYYYDVYELFFDKMPASTYVSDDLSSLVEN